MFSALHSTYFSNPPNSFLNHSADKQRDRQTRMKTLSRQRVAEVIYVPFNDRETVRCWLGQSLRTSPQQNCSKLTTPWAIKRSQFVLPITLSKINGF